MKKVLQFGTLPQSSARRKTNCGRFPGNNNMIAKSGLLLIHFVEKFQYNFDAGKEGLPDCW